MPRFDRLGRYEPAATIAGFAFSPSPQRAAIPRSAPPSAHLREVLGDETHESFTHKAGASTTAAAMVTYTLDQIDQARAQLLQDGESP